jgi:hypothetical protein
MFPAPSRCPSQHDHPHHIPSAHPASVFLLLAPMQAHCTATYRAPELFDVPSPCIMDGGVDVWALGCTLYVRCPRATAFPTPLTQHTRTHIYLSHTLTTVLDVVPRHVVHTNAVDARPHVAAQGPQCSYALCNSRHSLTALRVPVTRLAPCLLPAFCSNALQICHNVWRQPLSGGAGSRWQHCSCCDKVRLVLLIERDVLHKVNVTSCCCCCCCCDDWATGFVHSFIPPPPHMHTVSCA